jgi:hypothetical protein
MAIADNNIQVGDLVHARLYNEDRSSVAMQDFYVTEITGTVYQGGALDCDTTNGWEIELVNRPIELLGLPEALSEITVFDKNDKPFHVMGKGENWLTQDGEKMELWKIYRWVDGHI